MSHNPSKAVLGRLIYTADRLSHRMPGRRPWLCDLLDISLGMEMRDFEINHVHRSRLNTWAARYFNGV